MKHKRRISWALALGLAVGTAGYTQIETVFVLLGVGTMALFLNYKVLMISSFVCCIGLCEHLRQEEKKQELRQQSDKVANEHTGCDILRTATVSLAKNEKKQAH